MSWLWELEFGQTEHHKKSQQQAQSETWGCLRVFWLMRLELFQLMWSHEQIHLEVFFVQCLDLVQGSLGVAAQPSISLAFCDVSNWIGSVQVDWQRIGCSF